MAVSGSRRFDGEEGPRRRSRRPRGRSPDGVSESRRVGRRLGRSSPGSTPCRRSEGQWICRRRPRRRWAASQMAWRSTSSATASRSTDRCPISDGMLRPCHRPDVIRATSRDALRGRPPSEGFDRPSALPGSSRTNAWPCIPTAESVVVPQPRTRAPEATRFGLAARRRAIPERVRHRDRGRAARSYPSGSHRSEKRLVRLSAEPHRYPGDAVSGPEPAHRARVSGFQLER